MRQLDEFVEATETLARLGIQVFAISHDPVAELKGLQERFGDSVTLLADPEGKAIAAFSMIDKDAFPKKQQARAGVFHIDNKGTIRHVWLTDSYRRRPKLAALLDGIKG